MINYRAVKIPDTPTDILPHRIKKKHFLSLIIHLEIMYITRIQVDVLKILQQQIHHVPYSTF